MRYHARGTVSNHGERMIYACSIRNFSYSLKKSGLWGKYFPALVASPRCDRCGRAGRTMLAGKGLHYHRKSSIITTQLKKRFIQIPSKTGTRHYNTAVILELKNIQKKSTSVGNKCRNPYDT